MIQRVSPYESNIVETVLWHGLVRLPMEQVYTVIDMTADWGIGKNSEVHTFILSAHIQPTYAKLIRGHFTNQMGDDSRSTVKGRPSKGKGKGYYLVDQSQSPDRKLFEQLLSYSRQTEIRNSAFGYICVFFRSNYPTLLLHPMQLLFHWLYLTNCSF